MRHHFQGPNHAVATACTAGAHAIIDATRILQQGDADVMVCGGTESAIEPLTVAGFCRAKALAEGPFHPHISRPFDRQRSGFVLGEGAGVLVLETLEHAERRGARVLAEVAGYGMSADAHHITAPPDDGRGARLSMMRALEKAGMDVDDVDYVNAHATSTALGDAAEMRALERVMEGRKTDPVPVSSTKGATGHLLGAAGAVEAIIAIQALLEVSLMLQSRILETFVSRIGSPRIVIWKTRNLS